MMKAETVQPTRYTILGILAGLAVSIILILWLKNKFLGPVLGTLVAILVARPTRIRDFAALGGGVGMIIGPAIGVWQYLFQGQTPAFDNLLTILVAILSGIILNGCLCAIYGVITGIIVHLYQKGQGPFF